MMASKLRDKLKVFLPPIVARYLRSENRAYSGCYSSWEEACEHSTGYDAAVILQKTRDAVLKVKDGQAAYERDSVLFNEVEYSWPLLSGLLWAASRHNNELSVLDFGGSLGSTYYQNRFFLEHLSSLRWSIVEQEHYVEAGNKDIGDSRLIFYKDIDSCIEKERPCVAVFSSVLQYLERPFDIIKKVAEYGMDHVIIDRTLFIERGHDRIVIQKVPGCIYDASYPVWLFNMDSFMKAFLHRYDKIAEFDALSGRFYVDGVGVADKGIILRRKGI